LEKLIEDKKFIKINTIEIPINLIILQQLEIIWWTLLLKIIDLSETIVFVLRKKDQQISFLHTYHHLSTVLYTWLTIKYLTHSFLMTLITLNSSVHVIMYSYYFLSTFGSNVQRRLLPFKKWITTIQMVSVHLISRYIYLDIKYYSY